MRNNRWYWSISIPLLLIVTGCAGGAMSTRDIDELKQICEAVVPCEPCPAVPPCPGTGDTTPTPIPPPNPPPIPEPTPPPVIVDPPMNSDGIDLSTVSWLHPSPAAFKVTATLSNVKIDGKTITWNWTHPTTWGEEDGNTGRVVGNMWVFANIDGQWYASTWEWLRRDTVRSKLEAKAWQAPFVQAEREPIKSWRPKHGERVGFMTSTMCRGGIPKNSIRERSPIVWVRWP